MQRLGVATLLTALTAAAAGPADSAEREYVRLRERARLLVHRGCGECHDGARTSALPKALAVFDTRPVDWAAQMSVAQLKDAAGRLSSDVVPTQGPKEMKPLHVSPLELSEFHAFVNAETARRAERR